MMTIDAIKQYLPHRFPFLLVDRVLDISGNTITALKNVTANENFFKGHFPEKPVMPGVLQIEALAQTGCILIIKQEVENPSQKIVVFTGIKNAKFRKTVVPGDQLKMKVELIEQRRNYFVLKGLATVDGNCVCELEASAAIVPNEKL